MLIHDVCPVRSATVACGKCSMVSICYFYNIHLSIVVFLVYILQYLWGKFRRRALNAEGCKCGDTGTKRCDVRRIVLFDFSNLNY